MREIRTRGTGTRYEQFLKQANLRGQWEQGPAAPLPHQKKEFYGFFSPKTRSVANEIMTSPHYPLTTSNPRIADSKGWVK